MEGGGLRRFRMDKNGSVQQGQATLLRYFRSEEKNQSSKKSNESEAKESVEAREESTSPVIRTRAPGSPTPPPASQSPAGQQDSSGNTSPTAESSLNTPSTSTQDQPSEKLSLVRKISVGSSSSQDSNDKFSPLRKITIGTISTAGQGSGEKLSQVRKFSFSSSSTSSQDSGEKLSQVRKISVGNSNTESNEKLSQVRKISLNTSTTSSQDSSLKLTHIRIPSKYQQSPSSSSSGSSNGSTSPVLQRKMPADDNPIVLRTIVNRPSSTVAYRTTLSRPLYVDPPSPQPEEAPNNDDHSSSSLSSTSSENPLGGMSMKSLISINKPAPTVRTISVSSDPESQDSPIGVVKGMKRGRLVTSSDEEDDGPASKKPLINGHSSTENPITHDMPDDDTIEKFLLMWESVYPHIDKMEFIDIYKANNWNTRLTMTQLGQLSKERKAQLRATKMEEEQARRKELAEKKDQLKKQKAAEKEQQTAARVAMKEKLKAKKNAWKKKQVGMDDQDLEEEEEDYQMTSQKVYDSDQESGEEEEEEENSRLSGDRQLVLKFFNEGSVGELAALSGCSKKKAEIIDQLRPFTTWEELVYRLQREKYVSTDLLNEAKSILHLRSTINKLMKKCENIALEMQSIVSRIVSGEEDAGISKQPEILNPEMCLKGYQLIGLNWLVLMHEQELNGVLADEMGLGKTVQAIAFLAYLKEAEDPEQMSLIVVPSSTLDNWARELELWCPSLVVLAYHGSQEERRGMRAAIINNDLEEVPDIILTTYNMVSTSTEDRALFKKLRFHTVILDEAHMLKNMASQRYENLMKIKAHRRVLLTGTPLQNNLVELMSILIFVMPQLFDSKKEELRKVFTMFPKAEGSKSKGKFERERIEQAKRIMKPFFLRRLKCDVLKDLPVKRDRVVFSPMSQRQDKIYRDTVSVLSKKARQHELEIENINVKKLSELEELEATGGSGKTKEGRTDTGDASSNMLMTLRKVANHPLLIRNYYTDQKLREIAKIMKKTSHRDSVLEYIVEDFSVMSDFEIHNTCKLYNATFQHCLSNDLILNSGKMEQLDILLPKLQEEGSRVLLFSQFVIVLDILERYIKLRGYRYLRFDGTTQVSERQELIDQFTEEEDIFVFLLSTRAGGLGINLTAANTVILHDIDFNPYNDKQAEDRCHRVGQTKAVQVIRLISKGTIEEGMLQIARDKLQLERDVTGLEEEEVKKKGDVVSLLRAALGLVPGEGRSNPSHQPASTTS